MNDHRTADLTAQLIDLWRQALGTDDIGPDDDFFELGGSSITAIRLVPLMGERLGVEPELTLLFDHPTPAELAAAIAPLIRPHAATTVAAVAVGSPGA